MLGGVFDLGVERAELRRSPAGWMLAEEMRLAVDLLPVEPDQRDARGAHQDRQVDRLET